ncbi:MAG TPA: heme o synthase [Chloroflexota bacterium]|nr:heme o synthase [Chloroflexota bacterium]
MKVFRALAVAAAVATFILVILGAVVRVSGSGLGCGNDWPLCHGSLVPLFDLHTFIEWNHRLFASLVSLLTALAVVTGWLWLRKERPLLVKMAVGAFLLVVAQALLGAVAVKTDLSPQVVMAHLGTAMLCLAALLIMATLATRQPSWVASRALGAETSSSVGDAEANSHFHLLALWTTAATFVLLMSGSLVTGSGADYACRDWPLCNGMSLPTGGLPAIHFGHRLMALLVGLLIIFTLVRAIQRRGHNPGAARWATAAGALLIGQVIVGAFQVWLHFPPQLVATHIAFAEAVWGSLVIMTVLAYQERRVASRLGGVTGGGATLGTTLPAGNGTAAAATAGTLRQMLADYLALTKPEIILLLLVTTVCAMYIATRGMPSPGLVLWTTIGGALSAGGANALNCYVDHDIDDVMTRTRRRPIPAGRMTPGQVLAFGLTLGVLSFLVMLLGVNMLAAVLSLSGLLFYVFVYTLWLKRSTPSNIVIGGAAGAVPPLVGWAAATGRVDLAAWWLFAIIFFWTPPHFWALALLIKKDYARAGIPMLPVVETEDHTRMQIFLYSLLLLPLSAMLFFIGALGAVYLVAALALSGLFVYYALRLLRGATQALARRLYRYSLLYLALLFGAMVVDHAVTGLLA